MKCTPKGNDTCTTRGEIMGESSGIHICTYMAATARRPQKFAHQITKAEPKECNAQDGSHVVYLLPQPSRDSNKTIVYHAANSSPTSLHWWFPGQHNP